MPSPPLSIVQSLSPRIAVLTADDVVESCEANGCRGFEELLRPWEGGTERVSILSSVLAPTIHPTFPLRFVSWASIFPDPTPSSPNSDVVVDMISGLIGARKPEDEQHYPLTRSLLLSARPLACHETFNHPVGLMLAVSTATPDPLGTLQRLHGRSIGPMAQAVPWMDGVSVIRLYVVVHDVSRMGADLTSANELLANVKKAHGPHSTLLVINSQVERRRPPPSPDVSTHPTIPLPRPLTPDATPTALSQVYASALSSLTLSPMAAAPTQASNGSTSVPATPTKPARRKLYGAKLNAEDTQRLAALVRELVVQSLIPWMEARVREWNEVYHSNKRGITGRLFGAGKKFFGASRPNSPAPNGLPIGYNTVKGYYPVIAIEALSRRLADFAFMLRDYRYAAGVYDSLRRDYAQDRAWRYAAAATEMYGLSSLLSHPYFLPTTPPTPPSMPFTTLQHTDISSWLEQAVTAYQSRVPPHHIQLDALRITILYYEAWKTIGEWRGLGPALVRAAGEAEEVPNAVMIEEAAAADIRGGKSQRGKRRRAFDLVLAARRYETAGLKTYSRRCLDRASQNYRGSPWTAAQDRIEYSLGRQAYTLGESDLAVEHFLRLLRTEEMSEPGSQSMVLEDLALAYEQLVVHPDMLAASSSEKMQLPTPIFDSVATKVIASSSDPSSSRSRDRWDELEATALSTWDRKGKKPMRLLPDADKIVVAVNEPFHVELVATNPLNSPLTLSDVTLETDQTQDVTIEKLSEIVLEPYEVRAVRFEVKSASSITLEVTAISFSFGRFFPCHQSLKRKGKRLQSTQAQRITPTYTSDTTLSVTVEATRPTLSVDLQDLPESAFVGEEVHLSMTVRNLGEMDVSNLELLTSEIALFRLDTKKDSQHDTPATIPNSIATNKPIAIFTSLIRRGQSVSVPLIFNAFHAGTLDVLSLLVFSGADDDNAIGTSTLARPIHVYPLAELSAIPRPLRHDVSAYRVAVDVTNVTGTPFDIDRIHFVSRIWTCTQSNESPTRLLPNQYSRTLIIAQLPPAISPDVDLLQRSVVSTLGELVQGHFDVESLRHQHATSSSPIPLGDAPTAFLSPRNRYRLGSLHEYFPTIPAIDLPYMFPLFDALDLDIVISWSIPSLASEPRRSGHTYLHSVRLAPEFSSVETVRREVDAAIAQGGKQTRTMYEETGRLRRILMSSVLEGHLAREEDPLHVRIAVPGSQGRRGRVEHAVTTGPTTLPVTFELQNRSLVLDARWVLRLGEPSSGLDAQQDPLPALAIYTGATSHRGTIPAASTHTIEVSIWVDGPSIVNLGGWQLDVETGEESDGVWISRRSWSRTGAASILEVVEAG